MSWASLVCALIVVIPPANGMAQTRASAEVSLAEILDHAGEYVRQFEQAFTTVISDEIYEQRVRWEAYEKFFPGVRVESSGPSKRRVRSEMLFMWLPEEQTWLSVRNVQEVDGQGVPDAKQRLEGLLRDTSSERVPRFRKLLDEGTRFNLGTVHRNFADATLALQFLDPAYQRRFIFTLAGQSTIGKVTVATLDFAEDTQPTVIRSEDADVFSKGSLWVRPSDGAVVRTKLTLTIPTVPIPTNVAAEVTVDYSHDPKLDMWVPSRMTEQYVQTYWSLRERINCVASYSNFRRFETSGRVITTQP